MTAPRIALALFVAALLALVAAAHAALEQRVSPRDHQEYVAALRRLDVLRHRANEQVLRAHAGLTGSYDALDHTMRELRSTAARAETIPSFVEDATRIRGALSDVTAAIATESSLVEAFKSEHAVLRNSLRFFPVAATAHVDALEHERDPVLLADNQRLAAALRALLRDVLELAAFGGEEAAEQVRARIAALDPMPAALHLALRHAEVIARRAPRAERVLRDILALPLGDALEDVEVHYESAHAAALERAQASQRVVVVLLLLCVALLAVTVIARMHATAAALASATERLRGSLEQQHRFVSMTSHEFRTPLSVIMSSTDLLDAYSERWDLGQRRTHLARITRAARGMTDLLDGLLLIGRSDAGHTDFRPADVDVSTLARDVVEAQRARAKDDKTVVLEGATALPELRLDPRLFRHVMDNLVSNAIKYSKPGGEVRVSLSLADDTLRLRVTDHGIGIPEADRVRLFESFHRASNVGVVPGTGLGLAIVKRALDQHRAHIEVTSEVGVGSTFEVAFPTLPTSSREADELDLEPALSGSTEERP